MFPSLVSVRTFRGTIATRSILRSARDPTCPALKIECRIRDDKLVVESLVGVNISAGTPHSQRIIEGTGHFFNFVPKSFYNDGLMS
jgi:hypothetical protein